MLSSPACALRQAVAFLLSVSPASELGSLARGRGDGHRSAQAQCRLADATEASERPRAPAGGGTFVLSLRRFAVKGLDYDRMDAVALARGEAFPHDRSWALLFASAADGGAWDAQSPQWLHKANFLCAFTAGKLLASFATAYDDATGQLTVSRRPRSGDVALRASLGDGAGRRLVAEFFGNASGRATRLVASAGRPHQFGNTGSGVSASGDTRTVHIVNANTVAALSAAAGVALDAGRFRSAATIEPGPPTRLPRPSMHGHTRRLV